MLNFPWEGQGGCGGPWKVPALGSQNHACQRASRTAIAGVPAKMQTETRVEEEPETLHS